MSLLKILSATKENSIYMESISGKTAKFQASFEALSNSIVNGGLVKHVVDGGTSLITIFDSLIKNFGGLAKAIAIVDLAYIAFDAIQKKNILNSLAQIPANIKASASLMQEAYAAGVASVSTGGLSASVVGLSAAFKSLWVLNPMIVLTALTVAAYGAYKAFDYFNTTTAEHKEQLSTLKSEYDEITTELQSLDDELKTTVDRIKELEGKELTIYEEEELAKLKTVNTDLERQIKLQKILQQEKDKQKRTEFVATMDSDLSDNSEYHADINGAIKRGQGSMATSDSANEKEYLSEQFDLYQEHNKKLAELQEQRANTDDQSNQKRLDKAIQNETKSSNDIKKIITDKYTELSALAEGFKPIENPLSNEDEAYNKQLEWLTNFGDLILTTFDGKSQKVLDFEKVVNDVDFSNVKTSLEDLASQSKLTAETLSDKKYKDFINALIESGFIADDTEKNLQHVADVFNKLADGADDATNSTQSSSDSLTSLLNTADSLKSLNSAFDDFKEQGSVSLSTLADISEKFKDVNGIDNYLKKLSDVNITSAELNDTLGNLTQAYINQQFSVEQLANADVNRIALILKEAGVANSTEVATNMITEAKIRLKIASFDLVNATDADIRAFLEEMRVMGMTESAISSLSNMYSSAQATMTSAAMIGAQKRLDISKAELANVRSVAQAYALLANKTGSTGRTQGELETKFALDKNATEIIRFGAAVEKINSIKLGGIPNVSYAGGGSKSPKSSGSGGGSKAEKTPIEIYKAEIDRLYELEERLAILEERREKIEKRIALTDNTKGKVKYLKEVNKNLVEQQKHLHNLNNTRDNIILENLKTLIQHTGIGAEYNPETNELIIKNRELLNNVYGETNEKTNELRKYYEDLIKETIDLNEANKDASLKYFDLAESIRSVKDEVADSLLKPFDDLIAKAEDFDLFGRLNLSKIDLLNDKLAEANRLFKHGYLSAEKYKNVVHDIAKEIYDEKSNSINKIIDLTMDLIKQENETAVDVLEEKKKAYSDIIKLKKESLRLAKEENNYQKSLSQKLDEISKIQSQINELRPDTSRESIAQQKKLGEDLAKLQGDLDDTQADHAYDAQQESLDKQQESFEDEKDNEIKKTKEIIDSTQKLYDLAIKRIDSDWYKLYSDLIEYNNQYGEGIRGQDSIVSAWREAKGVVDEYGESVKHALELLKHDYGNISEGKYPSSVYRLIDEMRDNSAKWFNADENEQGRLASDNKLKAKKIELTTGESVYQDQNGVWRIGSDGKSLYDVSSQDYSGIVRSKAQLMYDNSQAWWYNDENGKSILEGKNNDLANEISALIGKEVYKNENSIWTIGGTGESLFDKYINDKSVKVGQPPASSTNRDAFPLDAVDLAMQKIVNGMIENSKQWKIAWNAGDYSKASDLAEENERIVREDFGNLLGSDKLVKNSNDEWIFERTGDKLYDMYYHTGGVVGNNPTLKQNEALAVLEKKEMVLDSKKQQGLYKLLDVSTFIAEKFNGILDKGFDVSSLSMATQNLFNPLNKIITPNQNSISNFSPNIEVSVNGVGNNVDANKLGNTIANITMGKITQAISKGGFAIKNPQFNNG